MSVAVKIYLPCPFTPYYMCTASFAALINRRKAVYFITFSKQESTILLKNIVSIAVMEKE